MELGSLSVRLQADPAGVLESAARPDPFLVIHFGAPVEIGCERGGQSHQGLSIHGDVDVIPAGMASRWILKKPDCALVIRVPQNLLLEAAGGMGLTPANAVLRNRFQVRDEEIEHLGWALKAELDQEHHSGRLYADCIGMALSCRLLHAHNEGASKETVPKAGALAGFRLRRVLAYIEDNLHHDLPLDSIAAVGDLSVSHCQRAFRNTVGVSLHQYVIQRRVERAKLLLADNKLSIAEVAGAVGFSHQSHLAHHTRRLLGTSPVSLRKTGQGEPLA